MYLCLSLHEKLDLHKFIGCKYGAKKVQTRCKSKAKMVNTALACQFTRSCKFEGKRAIYHLCLIFNLSLHFFCTKFALSKFDVNQIFCAEFGRMVKSIKHTTVLVKVCFLWALSSTSCRRRSKKATFERFCVIYCIQTKCLF